MLIIEIVSKPFLGMLVLIWMDRTQSMMLETNLLLYYSYTK